MKNTPVRQTLVSAVHQYKEDMYRLAFSYVKNQADALDVVQSSIEKALKSVQRLQQIEAMKSWLLTIVVRTSLDILRKQTKVTVLEEEAFTSYGREDRYPDLDLIEAIDALPIKYRSIIILRFFEDFKIHEIAHMLEENENTVKSRLYKALKLLRVSLSEEDIGQ
ncbi:sigma-70 family RNA polymerase sigma factor [Bacillaceae bacterium SIJ1]|uniref:RNA polymerase sigma factor n=1 Tax=Litoribacterium kuwaitense TaxID=1398745 RepID=UPI0013EA4FDF|nr:RNA polymerase sigma factor [Litoribacterium kuwaitense]NGP45932.1 sigma-70 family RNA polymerase sigma factor [Litoribacterium kuwaitense]